MCDFHSDLKHSKTTEYEWMMGCPGFGWDRVNFHKKLEGDTAGTRLTQTGQTNGIFDTM